MSANPSSDEKTGRQLVGEPGYVSRRVERRMRRLALRQERYGSGAWVAGAVLILIGAIFMLQNLGITSEPLANWWALILLIPAAGAYSAAWNSYQGSDGRLTAAARASLIGGVILTLLAGALLFELQWDIFWPLIIILIGVGALLGAWLRV